jgi:CDP-ribitol ribitolphosphotransferase / teichoic acid ribitol-phosphate polymerase
MASDLAPIQPPTTSRPGRTPADAVAMDLLAAGWERIQCTFRFARPDGAAIEPSAFRLARVDPPRGPHEPAQTVAPAHAAVDDGDVVLRVNVMQGPEERPLAPGSWALVAPADRLPGAGAGADHTAHLPVQVRDGRPERGPLPAAGFVLGEGLLSFAPSIDAGGSLRLQVELDPAGKRQDRPRSIPQRAKSRVRRWIRPLRRGVFRALFVAARATRRPGKPVILFASHAHGPLTGNLKLVHDRMAERGIQRDHRLRSLFAPPPGIARTMRYRLRLPSLFARADVVLLDDHYPLIYAVDFGPDVKLVQLWHASGAFKTVGYSRAGRPGAPSPYGRTHKNYTHAIVSSRYEVRYYAEAFGLPESRVHPTGIPRMDRFFDEPTRAAGRARTHARFPGSVDRMTILFAPTFRGDGARTADYDMESIDFGRLHALCLEKDACVIFRMHPFVRRRVPIPAPFADRLFDGSGRSIEMNDLLPAADLLITDYSSTVFEFAALGRPMLFYAYDLEEYTSGRGFYTPYTEFVPGRIVQTFPELLDAILRDDYQVEKVAAFAAHHLDHVDGRSTDRVIDLILEG